MSQRTNVSYPKRFVGGTLITFLMYGFAGFSAYLLRLLLAHELTVTEYGLFFSVLAFISLLVGFKDIGVHEALVKFIPEMELKKKWAEIKGSMIFVIVLQMTVSIMVMIILFIVADYLASNFFHQKEASLLIKLLGIYLALLPMSYVIQSTFKAFQSFGLSSLMEFSRMFMILVLSGVFLLFGLKLQAPAYAYVVTVTVSPLFYYWLFKRKLSSHFSRIRASFGKKLALDMVGFGFLVFLSQAGRSILFNVDKLFITRLSTLADVAYYTAAQSTVMVLALISGAISIVIFPMIAQMWAKKEKEQVIQGAKLILKYAFLIMMPLAVLLFCFPGIVVNLLFGNSFAPSYAVLRILSVGILAYGMNTVISHVLDGIGKPGINTKNVLIISILNVVGNFILIPLWGIEGAAVATVLSFLLLLVLSSYYVYKIIGLEVPLTSWIKTFIASAIVVLLLNFLRAKVNLVWQYELPIMVMVLLVSYALLVIALRIVKAEEIAIIKNIIPKTFVKGTRH